MNQAFSKIWIVIILVVFLAGGILWFSDFWLLSPLLPSSNNESPNMAIDKQGNLHFVWVSGEESYYEQNLYYKKIDPNGKTLIDTKNLSRIERILAGPEVVVDSKNSVHIFTGHEVLHEGGMIIQHLIVENGVVSFKREIKKGDETREPVVGIDNNDNIYLIYSIWNAIKDGRGITIDWDIRYYLEKLSSRGEVLAGPVEIAISPHTRKIIVRNDKLYFAVGLTDKKFKYAEMDKNGKLLRLLDSPVKYYVDTRIGKLPLAVLVKDNALPLCFNNNCIVDNNIYYFYSLKKRGERKCYLRYKKFDQIGRVVREGKITEFAKGPFYWIFDPVIFNIRAYIDRSNNSNIIYYINDGFNNFAVFYSKMNADGKVLIERLKIP